MNDDFLYKRQEAPDPVFVMQLKNMLEMPVQSEKPKRKHEKRFINWKLLVAVMALFIVGGSTLILANYLGANTAENNRSQDILDTAEEAMGIKIPTLPERYGLFSVEMIDGLDATVTLHLGWNNIEEHCPINATIYYYPQDAETIAANQNVNEYMAEIDEFMEMIPIGEEISAFLHLPEFNMNYIDTTSLEWRIGNNDFIFETYDHCLSREEFIAVAQSTLP